MPGDLTSDPAAEGLAASSPGAEALAAADARSGGRPELAPRSLSASERVPDDEQLASGEDWDDPEVL